MEKHVAHYSLEDIKAAVRLCGLAYVKFTLREDGAIVISFKAL